jgi:hypothetical protein
MRNAEVVKSPDIVSLTTGASVLFADGVDNMRAGQDFSRRFPRHTVTYLSSSAHLMVGKESAGLGIRNHDVNALFFVADVLGQPGQKEVRRAILLSESSLGSQPEVGSERALSFAETRALLRVVRAPGRSDLVDRLLELSDREQSEIANRQMQIRIAATRIESEAREAVVVNGGGLLRSIPTVRPASR